jgi:hypothetical protein
MQDENRGRDDNDGEVRLAKSQVISVRLSDQELRLLASEARSAAMTVGAFIKHAAMEAARVHRFTQPAAITFGMQNGGIGFAGPPANQSGIAGSGAVQLIPNDGAQWTSAIGVAAR